MNCHPKGKVQEEVTQFLDSNMRSAPRRKDLNSSIANMRQEKIIKPVLAL